MIVELLKAFFRNPFQKKYIPVFACLLMLAVFTPITHQASSVIVPLILGLFNVLGADKPLEKIWFWGYVILAALFSAQAVMCVFVGVPLAALVAGVVAALPISIVFTRKLKEVG